MLARERTIREAIDRTAHRVTELKSVFTERSKQLQNEREILKTLCMLLEFPEKEREVQSAVLQKYSTVRGC